MTPTLAEVPLLFGVGLSGALAQWLLSVATVLVGAVIVIASNALIIWRESRRGALTGARIRAKF